MKTIREYIKLIEDNEYYEPPVVQQQVRNLNLDKLNKQYKRFDKSDVSADFKAGAFAYGRDIGENPHQSHTFRKTEFFPSEKENNPFFTYIDKIKKIQGENPYVPTVSEIKITTAANVPGKQKVSYSLLKLVPYTRVPPLQLYFACAKVITSCDLPNREKNIFHDLKRQKELRYNDLLHDENTLDVQEFVKRTFKLTRDLLNDLCSSEIDTNDTKLQEVINILISLKLDNFRFFYDFNPGNIMFRLSGHGAQLVITDPIATMESLT